MPQGKESVWKRMIPTGGPISSNLVGYSTRQRVTNGQSALAQWHWAPFDQMCESIVSMQGFDAKLFAIAVAARQRDHHANNSIEALVPSSLSSQLSSQQQTARLQVQNIAKYHPCLALPCHAMPCLSTLHTSFTSWLTWLNTNTYTHMKNVPSTDDAAIAATDVPWLMAVGLCMFAMRSDW